MPLITNVSRVLRAAAVIGVFLWHFVWPIVRISVGREMLLRTVVAIVCLLIATSFLKDWGRSSARKQDRLQGIAVIGLSLAAANLYFVRDVESNWVLAAISLTLISVGLIGQRLR